MLNNLTQKHVTNNEKVFGLFDPHLVFSAIVYRNLLDSPSFDLEGMISYRLSFCWVAKVEP